MRLTIALGLAEHEYIFTLPGWAVRARTARSPAARPLVAPNRDAPASVAPQRLAARLWHDCRPLAHGPAVAASRSFLEAVSAHRRRIMLGAGQCPYPLVSAIPRNNPREDAPRQKIRERQRKASMPMFTGAVLRISPKSARSSGQNRHHAKRQKHHRNQNAIGQLQPSLSRTDVQPL